MRNKITKGIIIDIFLKITLELSQNKFKTNKYCGEKKLSIINPAMLDGYQQ